MRDRIHGVTDKEHAVTLKLPLDAYKHFLNRANLDDRPLSRFMVKYLTERMNTEKKEEKNNDTLRSTLGG